MTELDSVVFYATITVENSALHLATRAETSRMTFTFNKLIVHRIFSKG